MSRRSLVAQGVAAGLGVVAVDLWPVLLIWRAGASGSVGDLREVRFLWVGVAWAVLVGALAGWAMVRALPRAAASPRLGRLDPWGAYALGLGVYSLALTAVPAIVYGLLLTDENRSLADRGWLLELLWYGGHLAAVAVAFLAAWALLRPGRGRSVAEADDVPSGTAAASR